LLNYALAPLPLSHGAPELTSGNIQVAEHRSGKIRGGGVALRCAPPYFDHCTRHNLPPASATLMLAVAKLCVDGNSQFFNVL